MTDELLLTAAKLREQATGTIEGHSPLHKHAGLVTDQHDRRTFDFLASTGLDMGKLGSVLEANIGTREASQAVARGDSMTLSAYVGVTEQDLDASALRLPLRLLERLDNHEAPAFITASGNPNTGKTNTVNLLAELRRYDVDELLVVSNIRRWDGTDIYVSSMHDLAVTLLEHRDVPKFVVLDEGSTHFDARTYRREVATQYTPVAKRYAKIGVDVEAVIIHTGKDLHPERKALTTTAFYKTDKKTAEFYSSWPRDADFPTDRVFSGDLENLEKAIGYDPDDAAPWSWNLEAELFTQDLDWDGILEELKARGPADA